MVGGYLAGSRTPILLGALALGWARKEGWLEKLPVLGTAGPVTSFGLLGWGAQELLHLKLPPILDKSITAALAISAFNIGLTAGSAGGTQLIGDGGAVVFD